MGTPRVLHLSPAPQPWLPWLRDWQSGGQGAALLPLSFVEALARVSEPCQLSRSRSSGVVLPNHIIHEPRGVSASRGGLVQLSQEGC